MTDETMEVVAEPTKSERHLRAIRTRLTAIALILCVVVLYFAKDLFLPVILGALIAITLSPIVRVLSRVGVPSAISAALVIIGLGCGIASVAYFASSPISGWIQDAPKMGQTLEWKLRGLNDAVEAVQDATKQVDDMANAAGGGGKDGVQKVVIAQPAVLDSAVSTVVSIGTSAVLALVLALFLLASNNLFYQKLIAAFPRFADKKRALRTVYDIEKKVSRYLLTITIINACLGLTVGAILVSLGMPDAYIWGLFAGLLNFLPFIGMLVGTTLVTIFSIISFDSLSYAMLAPGLYFLVNAFEGQIITPTIVGRRLELNTVAVFLSVVFWGWIWGIAGALMAVPILVLIKVICDNTPDFETIGNFLGAEGSEIDDDDEEDAAKA